MIRYTYKPFTYWPFMSKKEAVLKTRNKSITRIKIRHSVVLKNIIFGKKLIYKYYISIRSPNARHFTAVEVCDATMLDSCTIARPILIQYYCLLYIFKDTDTPVDLPNNSHYRLGS